MTKYKLKTHKGAKKRFRINKNGKIKRDHAFRSHILTKKSTKRKRNYRKTDYVDQTNAKAIKALMPYS